MTDERNRFVPVTVEEVHVISPTRLVSRGGLRISVHRLAWEQVIGPLTPYDFLIKECDVENCVQPLHYRKSVAPAVRSRCPNGHLYTGDDEIGGGHFRCHVCKERRTARRRNGRPKHWQVEAARQFCPQGHEYSPENTYSYPTPAGNVKRKCKRCARERKRHE